MIHRILPLLAGCLLAALSLRAQNAGDALRFSYFDVGGTGRFIGVGGSLGALGTEFSVLSTNPAGLAMYRSSEVVFSPSVQITNASSNLAGALFPGENTYLPQPGDNKTFQESRTVVNINNLGFIVHSTPREPSFTTMNFGIGFNQLANFNQRFYYEGETVGSIIERWQELANDFGIDDFEAGPAYDASALYELNPPDGFYYNDYELTYDENKIGNVLSRNQLVEAKGSMSELVFAIATNYSEKVMVGLTVGVPVVNYRLKRTYREIDPDANPQTDVPFFDDLTFEESVTTTGAGVNAKLGVLFRPHQAVRFGFAVHTPTALSLDDEYDLAITYNFTDDNGSFTGSGESNQGLFNYRLRTPWRFFGNAGFLINRIGFLTGEVEWVNYRNNNFRFDGYPDSERAANDDVANTLNQALNIRLGGEVSYDVFRFRAGLGLLQSPYSGESTTNLSYSAGVGIRTNSVFVDLAWRARQQSSGFVPYSTTAAPEQFINNDFTNHTLVLSLGVRY